MNSRVRRTSELSRKEEGNDLWQTIWEFYIFILCFLLAGCLHTTPALFSPYSSSCTSSSTRTSSCRSSWLLFTTTTKNTWRYRSVKMKNCKTDNHNVLLLLLFLVSKSQIYQIRNWRHFNKKEKSIILAWTIKATLCSKTTSEHVEAACHKKVHLSDTYIKMSPVVCRWWTSCSCFVA